MKSNRFKQDQRIYIFPVSVSRLGGSEQRVISGGNTYRGTQMEIRKKKQFRYSYFGYSRCINDFIKYYDLNRIQ